MFKRILKMKSVRVVGVGLLLGAALMCSFGAEFFRWWMHDAASYVFITATSVLSPTTASAAGMQLVGGMAYAMLCLGVGLFVSAVVYSFLDDVVCWTLLLPARFVNGLFQFGREVMYRIFPARRFA